MAQTEMRTAKISIRGEAKYQGSSAKTIQLYIQKKRPSRVVERVPDQRSQKPWVLIAVRPDYLWDVGQVPFSYWVSVSPSISSGLCGWLLNPPGTISLRVEL